MPAFIFCVALFAIGATISSTSSMAASGLRIALILLSVGGAVGLVLGFLRSLGQSHPTPGNFRTEDAPEQSVAQSSQHTSSSVKARTLALLALASICLCIYTSRHFGKAEFAQSVGLVLAGILTLATLLYPRKRVIWVSTLVVLMMLSLASLKSGFDQSQIGLAFATGATFAGMFIPNKQPSLKVGPIGPSPKTVAASALRPEIGPGFSGVAGMADLKAKLLSVSREAMLNGGRNVRNGILLHGQPGNGKTYLVEALAQELRVPLIRMTYAEVGSKWIGETTEKILASIKQARDASPCVLFLDEADSLLEARGRNVGGGGGDYDRTANALLTEIVNLRGTGVLLIAATNFLDRLDAAAVREGRFDFKVEVPNPDMEARLGLLRSGLSRHAPKIFISDEILNSAARRWVGFSVKRLLAVTEQVPIYADENNLRELRFDDLNKVLRQVQGFKGKLPEGTKSIEDMVIDQQLKRQLHALLTRLKNTFEIEQAGGALPTGVLFTGQPGTGKTEAARALAKSSEWAFLPTTGNDLLQDPSRMDKLKSEAMNLRPALIFIDEADDLLMNREYSNTRNGINKLLAVMDGSDVKVSDIIWVAATNHPESLDPAVLRGGRFAEKYEFCAPGPEAIRQWADQWLAKKGWTFDSCYQYPTSLTIADGQAILQQAINNALARTGDFKARTISDEDLKQALETFNLA